MSGSEIVGTVVAGVMLLGFIVFVIAIGLDARTTEPRTCNACGHERGWHRTYWPTESAFGKGCRHGEYPDHCKCPAGRRSIR